MLHLTKSEESSSGQLGPRQISNKGYDSDDTDNDADEIDQPKKKGRGMAMDYANLDTVEDYAAALQYMNDQLPDYNKRYKRETEDGEKVYYHCAGYLKCPKVAYILLHADSFQN